MTLNASKMHNLRLLLKKSAGYGKLRGCLGEAWCPRTTPPPPIRLLILDPLHHIYMVCNIYLQLIFINSLSFQLNYMYISACCYQQGQIEYLLISELLRCLRERLFSVGMAPCFCKLSNKEYILQIKV